MVHDDPDDDLNMKGNCAENTAKNSSISREDQDAFAISSYTRSKAAWESGLLAKEVVSVHIPQKGKAPPPPPPAEAFVPSAGPLSLASRWCASPFRKAGRGGEGG